MHGVSARDVTSPAGQQRPNRGAGDVRLAGSDGLQRGLQIVGRHARVADRARPDLDELTDRMLAYMGRFEQVVSEGIVDEKRRFVRAFIQRIDVAPETQQVRLALRGVPHADRAGGVR